MTTKKSAIVTGASSGLGPAIAKSLLEKGYRLLLTGRDKQKLEHQASQLSSSESIRIVAADVSLEVSRHSIIEEALTHFGRIDALVNNAGIFSTKPFLEVSEADLDRYLDTNLKGTYFLSQGVIPHMQRLGGGAIVNIGTVLVEHALAGVPATAPVSSKGAIHALTVQLAAEFGADNIRVNTIAPGIIRTPMHQRNGIENSDNLASLHLVNRIGEPNEIGSMVAETVTNQFVSGAIINVDGGHVAGHTLT